MFSPGDKVRFLNYSGEGVIQSIQGEIAKVLDEDGFEDTYKLSELVSTKNDEAYRVSSSDVENRVKEEEVAEIQRALNQKSRHLERFVRGEEVWEIDLHIEELIDSHRGMSNSQVIQVQMARLRTFMYQARERKIRKVILIHGVGEGILRHEVRRFLDERGNAEYHDASYKEYGYGATEVHLKYN